MKLEAMSSQGCARFVSQRLSIILNACEKVFDARRQGFRIQSLQAEIRPK
jgi:hypothetical protein